MVKLDQRGDIAIGEIVVYIPIALISIALLIRHGFSRRGGWIYLVLLAIGKREHQIQRPGCD